MHDLNTINRLNAEGHAARQLESVRRSGKHVVAIFEGLHLVSFHANKCADGARSALETLKRSATPGQHFKLLEPLRA